MKIYVGKVEKTFTTRTKNAEQAKNAFEFMKTMINESKYALNRAKSEFEHLKIIAEGDANWSLHYILTNRML